MTDSSKPDSTGSARLSGDRHPRKPEPDFIETKMDSRQYCFWKPYEEEKHRNLCNSLAYEVVFPHFAITMPGLRKLPDLKKTPSPEDVLPAFHVVEDACFFNVGGSTVFYLADDLLIIFGALDEISRDMDYLLASYCGPDNEGRGDGFDTVTDIYYNLIVDNSCWSNDPQVLSRRKEELDAIRTEYIRTLAASRLDWSEILTLNHPLSIVMAAAWAPYPSSASPGRSPAFSDLIPCPLGAYGGPTSKAVKRVRIREHDLPIVPASHTRYRYEALDRFFEEHPWDELPLTRDDLDAAGIRWPHFHTKALWNGMGHRFFENALDLVRLHHGGAIVMPRQRRIIGRPIQILQCLEDLNGADISGLFEIERAIIQRLFREVFHY